MPVDVLTKLFGSLFSFGFSIKSAVVAVICESSNCHTYILPHGSNCAFHKIKERYHSFTDHLSSLLYESANFRFSVARVLIEEVSICVCVSLSLMSRATCAPPLFYEHYISLQENISRLHGLVSFSIYDRGVSI